jgi:type II secretory pathway pseudopilin PulG
MTDQSEAHTKHHKKKHKKIKKYSRAWWRIHRAKQKRKRALMARIRALKARQAAAQKDGGSTTELSLAKDAAGQPVKATVKISKSRAAKTAPVAAETGQPNILPSGDMAPIGWKRNGTAADVQFRLADNNGTDVGSADLKIVSPAIGADDAGQKSVGGVSTVALRRTVIDKMIRDQGWVVNDYQKDVDGRKVYVVVAQSPGGTGLQTRVFYFMEADGKVYSLATSAPVDTAEKVAQDSEKVLNSLGRITRPVQASASALR